MVKLDVVAQVEKKQPQAPHSAAQLREAGKRYAACEAEIEEFYAALEAEIDARIPRIREKYREAKNALEMTGGGNPPELPDSNQIQRFTKQKLGKHGLA